MHHFLYCQADKTEKIAKKNKDLNSTASKLIVILQFQGSPLMYLFVFVYF